MGFEVVFKYHDKIENGYDTVENKTFKKKFGDPYEDVPLSKLALFVMGQLARRDIWIVDVEINEFIKKSISFRENKGGIIIKNKKFSLDSKLEESVIVEEEIVASDNSTQQQSVNVVVPVNAAAPANKIVYPHEAMKPNKRPIGQMIFSPEAPQMHEVSKFKLTIDKKYSIYEKRISPTGELYVILDDLQRETVISDKYFIPAAINLIGDEEFANQQSAYVGATVKEPKLSWNGVVTDNIPRIR